MCEECHQHPCVPGCPNAPEPPIAGKCKECGETIYLGEDATTLDGKMYCQFCIMTNTRPAEIYEPNFDD